MHLCFSAIPKIKVVVLTLTNVKVKISLLEKFVCTYMFSRVLESVIICFCSVQLRSPFMVCVAWAVGFYFYLVRVFLWTTFAFLVCVGAIRFLAVQSLKRNLTLD